MAYNELNHQEIKLEVTEEERKQIISKLTGQSLDGKVDYSSLNLLASKEILESRKRQQAQNEILAYMIRQIQEEFNCDTASDALLRWDDYKKKHNISFKEVSKLKSKPVVVVKAPSKTITVSTKCAEAPDMSVITPDVILGKTAKKSKSLKDAFVKKHLAPGVKHGAKHGITVKSYKIGE